MTARRMLPNKMKRSLRLKRRKSVDLSALIKRLLLAFGAVALVFCLFMAFGALYSGISTMSRKESMAQVKVKMQEYLQNKYGKEFMFDKLGHGGGGFGVDGVWTARAYPVDDKSLGFDVTKGDGSKRFTDQYTAMLWSKSESVRLNRMMSGSNGDWKAGALVNIYLSVPLSVKATPANTRVEDVIRQDYAISYTLNLEYSSVDESKEEPAIRSMERLVAHLREVDGVRNLNVNYKITKSSGGVRECSMVYDEPYDYSYSSINDCLKERSS